MKKILLFVFFGLLLSFGTKAQVIWSLGFEDTTGYYTSPPQFLSSSTVYFERTDGSDISESYTGYDSTHFFAAQNIDGSGTYQIPDTLWTDTINILNDSNLTFSCLLASNSEGTWESTDYLRIFYKTSSDTIYRNLIWISADSTGTPALDTNFDSIGDISELSSQFRQFVASLPNDSTVTFMIVFRVNGSGEDIALDNLSIIQNFEPNPHLLSVYSTSDLQLEGQFEYNGGSTDTTDYVLHASGWIGHVSSVEINGIDVKLGLSQPVVADTVLDTLIYKSQDTLVFYAGIMPIHFTNVAYPNGHVQEGYPMTVAGIVTANSQYKYVWIADSSGPYHGLLIYDANDLLHGYVNVGDSVVILGEYNLYNGRTSLNYKRLVADLGQSNTSILPVEIDPNILDTNAVADNPITEPYEGVLVSCDSLTVIQGPDAYYVVRLKTTADTGIWVDDVAYYHYGDLSPFTVGQQYRITGIVYYYYGYKLLPRDLNDISQVITHLKSVNASIKVYPNPARNYLYLNKVCQKVELLNMDGRILMRLVGHVSNVNISQLKPGIYLLRLQTTDNKTVTLKFLKL